MKHTYSLPPVPALVPAPAFCHSIETPVICLDGTWMLLHTADYEKKAAEPGTDGYEPITVPSWVSPLHQKGFCGGYIYKRQVDVTKEMASSRVVLRMEGVNGFAAVFINGKRVMEYKNSFITWNVEITDAVRGCDRFELAVTVDERIDKVSTFGHGGICHSVYLYVLPKSYLSAVHTTTTFDEIYENAQLRLDFGIHAEAAGAACTGIPAADSSGPTADSDDPAADSGIPAATSGDLAAISGIPAADSGIPAATSGGPAADSSDPAATSTPALKIHTCLIDPEGDPVAEGDAEFDAADGFNSHSFSITSPLQWDAEHPNLYTITLELEQDGVVLERVSRTFGFRQIAREGNRLFVNGKEIKMRGSCRHEVTPLNGRATTRELIEEDVRLFKEANCNYIRTSHYPPSEYFLELCDRYGIYVEDELALAFIARTLDYTQQDPQHTTRYLTHFSDLVARDYSHPCVIIWSLCNESFGGYNFDLLNRFAKATDPTRVTKFSYPMTIREEYEPVDIWSIHYSNYEADQAMKRDNVSVGGSWGKDMPVIHDEFVHVPCYNRTEHRRDPHVREFWGMSIARFWDKIWNTEGALGGAIWAGIDETNVYLGGGTCLEWGIIDIWRRRKPEHYGTRRAYSPILLRGVTPLMEEIAAENGRPVETITWEGDTLLIPAENRFCHTNFSETTINGWLFKAADIANASIEDCQAAKTAAVGCFSVDGPDLEPFEKGTLSLPVTREADYLYLEWMDAVGNQVDEYLIPLHEGKAGTAAGCPILNVNTETDSAAIDAHADHASCQLHAEETSDLLYAEETSGLLRIFVRCSSAANDWHPSADHSSANNTDTDVSNANSIDTELSSANSIDTNRSSLPSASSSTAFLCEIDTVTGLFSQICRDGKPAITGGPTLHTPYLKLPAWALSSFSWEKQEDTVLVTSSGSYGHKADVTFRSVIRADGTITIRYTIDALHAPLPSQIKLRVGVDCGGLDELGITLEAASGSDTISWHRNGANSVYPAESIARCHGTANRDSVIGPFGAAPTLPWKDDCRHEILNGKYDLGIAGSNDFTSLKANLYQAEITSSSDKTAPWKVVSDGSVHLRAESRQPEEAVIRCTDSRISYSGSWWKMTDTAYESTGVEMWSNEAGASATVPFCGTGIIWYAPEDVNYGRARVLVDGVVMDGEINQRIDGVDFPGSSAGYDKKYHYPVFSVTGLEDGEHLLTIEVLGTHANDSCDSYIVLEEFYVLSRDTSRPTAIHLLKDYNYPHLAWGNWVKKPIIPKDGETGEVTLIIE